MPFPEPNESRPDREGKTVTLSELDIEDAIRLLRLLAGGEASSDVSGPRAVVAERSGDRNPQWLLSRARKAIRDRQLRTEYFNRAIFGEAAWDILLVLYVMDSAGSRQTQGTLSKRLTTPPTTVQRWVDYLEKENLVRRDPHPTDRRTAFVRLLDKGRKALDDYFTATSG